MSKVFVLDTNQRPLNPVHPGRARTLLSGGQAAVWRQAPFTIILKYVPEQIEVQPLRVKIDPGSMTSGISVVNDMTGEVVWAAELEHRGAQIRDGLRRRRAIRRGRRSRKTRYRAARFANRCRPPQWLPPSLASRVANIQTWIGRLRRWCPLTAITLELVKFDSSIVERTEAENSEYRVGELQSYEVRQYLLHKFDWACAYCRKKAVRLEIEHIIPKSRGGSHRVSNLTLACHSCNQAKGDQTAGEFGYPHIQAQVKISLKDAAAVNSTRLALLRKLTALALPLEVGTGGRTQYNRVQRNLPKTHWIDAACVGESTPPHLEIRHVRPIYIRATGHGNRQMCATDKFGFPIQHRARHKRQRGLQTGDLVAAYNLRGKYKGQYRGRVIVRARPMFRVQGVDVHPDRCRLLQHDDGYAYDFTVLCQPPNL